MEEPKVRVLNFLRVEKLKEAPSPQVSVLFPVVSEPKKEEEAKAAVLALPGSFVRKRLEVSEDGLRKIAPGMTDIAYKEAMSFLTVCNVDLWDERTVEQFGIEAQQACALSSDDLLRLSSDVSIDKAQKRIQSIRAMLEQEENWSRKMLFWLQPDQQDKQKVKNLANKLRQYSIPSLQKLRAGIVNVQQNIATQSVCMESLLVAGSYLSVVLQGDMKENFLRRIDSLSVTRLTLSQKTVQAKQQYDLISHLLKVIDSVVLNLIPAWQSKMESAIAKGQLSTEQPALNRLKNQIIEGLKG